MESQLQPLSYLRRQPRWDFRYFEPKYLKAQRSLESGKYPLESLGDHVREIVNFGAYSLCNLLVWVDNGVPYLRVTDLKEDGISWETVPHVPPEVHEQLPKSKVYSGDVLYSMAGTIGLAVIAPNDLGECNSNQAIAKIRLKPSGISPHYLATFFNSKFGRYQSERIANGQTVLNINIGEIGQLQIPIPPREAQDSIAVVMQSAYATRREKLAEAKRLVDTSGAWGLESLGLSFSGKANHRFFGVPNSVFVGERWDVNYHQPHNTVFDDATKWTTIEHYVDVAKDTFVPSKAPSSEFYYVAIEGMDNDPYSADDNAVQVRGTEINGLRQWFHAKDVLFARLAPCVINKKSVIVPTNVKEGCGSTEFIVIRPKESVDNRFVLWVLKTDFMLEQMQNKIRGAVPSRMRLHAEDLLKMQVPIASPQQQATIGTELETRRVEAKRLRAEAEQVVAEAKARVERMLLGEEGA